MLKKINFLLIILFLFSSLTNHSLAFHKKYKKSKIIYENIDVEKDKIKSSYCAEGVSKKKDDSGERLINDKQQPAWRLTGYHQKKSTKVKEKLDLNPANGLKFKKNIDDDWSKLKFVELLKMFCLQDSSKDRPSDYKKSYLVEFYEQVAAENGFVDENGKPDVNIKIFEGPFGKDIFKEGIVISNPNAVYYIPDYLIAEAKNLEQKKQKDKDAKRQKDRNDAIKKGNDSWISENKSDYIDQFEKKFSEYDQTIQALYTAVRMVDEKFKTYKSLFIETKDIVEETFDDVDVSKSEVKKLKKDIRKNVKKIILDSKVKDFEERIAKLKKIKFEKEYDNYKRLQTLIKKAKKSKSAKDFVGKDGITIKFLKEEIPIRSDKIGFIEEFENIKNKVIGAIESDRINKLDKEIENNISQINELVASIEELNNLDLELASSIPYMKYAIYILIFLIVSAGGVFIFLQSRKISSLSDETKTADRKFNELQGQIKSTSEQIKKARVSSGRSSTGTSIPETTVSEKPKTQEEIIAEKFDEMLSDYKESLDDFSKVAVFKQKWNGLALSRKERQDGSKTILINSSRAFEKAEIWCVNFSDKYFAFPGSTVKSNMAAYMNLDFEKASRDFKGVFAISSGSSYLSDPALLRRGGAGFVVEKPGKLIFPT